MSKKADKRGQHKIDRAVDELRQKPVRNQTGEKNVNVGQMKKKRYEQGGDGGSSGGGGGKKQRGPVE